MKHGKKLLLVNPPLRNFKEEPIPPLGLAYIAALVEKGGYDVKILDMPVLQISLKQAVRCFESYQPDIVGITCIASNYIEALLIGKLAKEACNPLVIIGGPHSTFISRELLRENPYIAIVVRGEGEQIMFEIMQAISTGKSLQKIRGITYRADENIYYNQDIALIKDLDSLPYPARHLLPMHRYKIINKFTSIIGSRGCPHNCIYCSASSFWKHKVRYRRPEDIIKEMKSVMETYGYSHFKFLDDSFILGDTRTRKLFELLKNSGIKWVCNTRVDLIDRDGIKEAKQAGCVKIVLGIESVSDKVLQTINKNTNILQIKNAINLIKENEIKLKLNFIVGLPGQTERDILMCLGLIEEVKPSEVMFNSLTAYPGTRVFDKPEEYGITLEERDWWKSNYKKTFIRTKELPTTKIDSLLAFSRATVKNLGVLSKEGY